jgi:nitroimidazol reductase NimA-like FMN-containing flavoprotein (pyridoxamine 5'-phosphate oxidase superfamily)
MPKRRLRLVGIHSVGPGGLPRSATGLTEARSRVSLHEIMDATELCSLSTVTRRGTAHSAHVYFAYTPMLELYFLSDPNSIHCTNLRTNPSMAVSIYDSTQRNFAGQGDRGVALYGRCREAQGREARLAEETYGRRFRPYLAWRTSPEYDKEAQKWRFYRFVTSRIKIFDEPKFGSGVFVVASIRTRM